MNSNPKEVNNGTHQDKTGISLVIENLDEEYLGAIANDIAVNMEKSRLMRLLNTVTQSLRDNDLPKTRLVITGNFIASVNTRENQTRKEFTMERGASIVAGKTMPPNSDGVVDILVLAHLVLPPQNGNTLDELGLDIHHIAAHEAVHASLFHNGNEPFDLHHRKEFEYAMRSFLAMASEQIEEHLAEFIGSKVTSHRVEWSADHIDAAIRAWQETTEGKLQELSTSTPDYVDQCIFITFEALHILWKSLSYLAAALRTETGFDPVSQEISKLPSWKESIEPWWLKYLEILGKIPMTVDVDIDATDTTTHELALHLQQWANDIGFYFYDTENGSYFYANP